MGLIRAVSAIMALMLCSCSAGVQYHELEGTSAPFKIEGVEITPAFASSKQQDWRGLNRGGPWYLYITCEAPADAQSVVISSADVEGQGWKESLLPPDHKKSAAFREMADGSMWIQMALKEKAIERTIAKDAIIKVTIRGEIVMKARTVLFDNEFEFRSVRLKENVEYNPLIDR